MRAPIEGDRAAGAVRRFVLEEAALLTRHRHAVVANISFVVVLGFLSSLFVGDQFLAHTSILPPPGPGPASLDHFVRRLPVALSTQGPVTIMDEVLIVAQSRRLGGPVVAAHDLASVYGAKNEELAFWSFRDHLDASLDAADILHLEFTDTSAARAAAVLNSLVDELNAFYTDARRTRGRLLVDLIQARVDSTAYRLAAAEVALGGRRVESRSVHPAREAVDAIARVTERAMMLEVELDVLSRLTASPTPLSVQRLAELESIHEQLRRQPVIELEELRLSRELVLQRRLMDMLLGQLAAAEALATREMPFIEVLDRAVPPVIRVWPGHVQFVLASFVVGLASAVLIAHLVSFVERNRRALRGLTWRGDQA